MTRTPIGSVTCTAGFGYPFRRSLRSKLSGCFSNALTAWGESAVGKRFGDESLAGVRSACTARSRQR